MDSYLKTSFNSGIYLETTKSLKKLSIADYWLIDFVTILPVKQVYIDYH